MVNVHRSLSKGAYETDLSLLNTGNEFPSEEIKGRNRVYKFMKRLYTGEYAHNKKLVVQDGRNSFECPYKPLEINYFKLESKKMDALFSSKDIVIKTGNTNRDKRIANLMEKTEAKQKIYTAMAMARIYGDSCLKVYKTGISTFTPLHCYKVVNESDVEDVIAYVISDALVTTSANRVKQITHIRFEIHTKDSVFECVREYTPSASDGTSGLIGESVDYEYHGRHIPKEGISYSNMVGDDFLVQWLSINKIADGCYGQSPYIDYMDLVFTLEKRMSSEMWVINNHEKPLLVLGQQMFEPDEINGGYKLKSIDGKYLIGREDVMKPYYVTWDGKLSESQKFREDTQALIYELNELGKVFSTGEYSGNISEETLKNLLKSPIDRASRECNEMYYAIRNAIYCLCRLNGISVKKEELSIDFGIGRIDDDKTIAEIIKVLHETGTYSMATLREKYGGLTEQQSLEEDKKIQAERQAAQDYVMSQSMDTNNIKGDFKNE